MAKSLLLNVSSFIDLNICEVLISPQAVWETRHDNRSSFTKITAVALSNDKKRVAVGINNFIHVVYVPTFVKIMNYSTKLKKISCCAFSPDNSLILYGKLATAFSIAEKKKVKFFPGNEEAFLSCAFSLNGKRLVTSDGSNTIKLWDVAKQSLLSSLCADGRVNSCSFSVTGLFIFGNSESSDWRFCVWNAITLQRSEMRKLSDVKHEEPGVLKSRKCERCYQRGFEEPNPKQLEIKFRDRFERKCIMPCPLICKDVECIFLF